MKTFLTVTENPEKMLERFAVDPIGFLKTQDYINLTTIKGLLNELQRLPESTKIDDIPAVLSKEGKRRFYSIVRQLDYLITADKENYAAGSKHVCTQSFQIGKYDEDGHSTGECMEIEEGSIWEVCEKAGILGGEVHIKNPDKRQWLELPKNTMKQLFEPIECENQ